MDDCCNTDSALAAWVGDQLHDGRTHSHRAGDCHYRYHSWLYSGATRIAGTPLVLVKTKKNGRFDYETKYHICDYTDHSGYRGIRLPGYHLHDKRESRRYWPDPGDIRENENSAVAAHCRGNCARRRHRAAGCGNKEKLMEAKMFQQRGGYHDR